MGASQGSLRERREAIVREHMESENHHDFDTTIATFAHPRYEIIPTSLAGRLSTLVSHPLTSARALLAARRRPPVPGARG